MESSQISPWGLMSFARIIVAVTPKSYAVYGMQPALQLL